MLTRLLIFVRDVGQARGRARRGSSARRAQVADRLAARRRTNGRMLVLDRPASVVLREAPQRVVDAAQVAGERPQAVERRAEHLSRTASVSSSASSWSWQRRPGSATARCTFGSWLAIAPSAEFEASTSCADAARHRWPTRAVEHVDVVDQVGEVLPCASRPRVLSRASPRLIGPRLPSSLPRSLPRPFRPWPAPDQQQPQVGPGVAVERGEDLVEVDVRRRVGERDRVAVLELVVVRVRVVFVPGSSSKNMSLRPVFGRSRIVAFL